MDTEMELVMTYVTPEESKVMTFSEAVELAKRRDAQAADRLRLSVEVEDD